MTTNETTHLRNGQVVPERDNKRLGEPPHVGDGATKVHPGDRYPYTVVAVSKNGKRITVKADVATFIRAEDLTGELTYEYTFNESAAPLELSLRRNGRWVPVGEEMWSAHFVVGSRRYHIDPHY